MHRLFLGLILIWACGDDASTPDVGAGDAGDGADARDAGDAGVDAGDDATDARCAFHESGELRTSITLDAWPDRAYELFLPAGYECGSPTPLIIALHGGGGSAGHMQETTCPPGVEAPAGVGCLEDVAASRGYGVVYPRGTRPAAVRMDILRTFNAARRTTACNATEGCCVDGTCFNCTSGGACQNNVDDHQFFTDLFDDLESRARVEGLFLTGFSNGAAMSHRLACELSERITAIAPVSGGNQLAAIESCDPIRPMPVLQIHGTDDGAWSFLGGPEAGFMTEVGIKVGIPETAPIANGPTTMGGWAARNGCAATPLVAPEPTAPDAARRHTFQECDADVGLIEIVGGEHAWPGGRAGPGGAEPVEDVDANQLIVAFFDAQR